MKKFALCSVLALASSLCFTGCVRTKTVAVPPQSSQSIGLKNPGLPAGANMGDGGRTICGTRNEVGADTFPFICNTPPNYGDAFDVRNQQVARPVYYSAPATADPVVSGAFVPPPAPTPRPGLSVSMGASVGAPEPISY